MSFLIGEDILNTPLLHFHTILHNLIHLNLPQKLALRILIKEQVEAKFLQTSDAWGGSQCQLMKG